MKKYFCFHCQEYVEPKGFWKLLFCPKCHKLITDDGNGFYKVCDMCGANLPPAAPYCRRCGYHFAVKSAVENCDANLFFSQNTWLSWVLLILIFIISIALILGVLYISFYAVGAFLLVFMILFLFNFLRSLFKL